MRGESPTPDPGRPLVCLVNPRATDWRCRIPLSVLSIGASLEGRYEYRILDGNIDRSLDVTLTSLIRDAGVKYVGFTVMPGPQLTHAILLSRLIRERFPRVTIVWGGYFPSLHSAVVLGAPYVDFVIRDQGDCSFRMLIDCLEKGGSLSSIPGLSYREGSVHHNEKQPMIDPAELPPLPYHRVDVRRYIGRTYVGSKTINYHSSVGCPFMCGFCAVASSYRARWAGLPAERIAGDLFWFRKEFGVNAVEFHDNNFFTSEKRTLEFAGRITGKGFTWWGEARPDTLLAYDDRTWRAMQESGCKMIFMGAESGSQHVLNLMAKGGTQTPGTILDLAERMKSFGIVPEFSFVLGSPTPTVGEDIEGDIRFIRRIKKVNPETEIIIYIYSPVQFDDADLFNAARAHKFAYPEKLDDWLLPEWQAHDLKKNPVTPWLRTADIRRIRNFERVLNARFPTLSDLNLTTARRLILRLAGSARYALSIYQLPYEIALLQKAFRYRQPDREGF
ncbi:MAG TPA: radical SAM protein [Bacteroidota bacterium]|nr:radical SAM protein [Bacteroidota bacterium]